MDREASIAERGPARRTVRLAADAAGIARAAGILRGGGLAAFPTETVYGLGADATEARAVAALYDAKGRPRFNPLIAHLPSVAEARREGLFGRAAERLAEAFWPGPLTLVVPRAPGGSVCDLARAGLASVALRVPAHPVAAALLAAAGRPIAAPSANRSGRISPTAAAHVLDGLEGRIHAVLDGGPTQVGVESTVVGCLEGGPVLLRPGGLARDAVEAVLGHALASRASSDAAPVSPGALASHYAPRARVRLGADGIRPGEAALLFGGPLPGSAAAAATLDLSPGRDLVEAAANLFAYLHRLDAGGAATIAVAPIPSEGLGEAINDRLRRAAA